MGRCCKRVFQHRRCPWSPSPRWGRLIHFINHTNPSRNKLRKDLYNLHQIHPEVIWIHHSPRITRSELNPCEVAFIQPWFHKTGLLICRMLTAAAWIYHFSFLWNTEITLTYNHILHMNSITFDGMMHETVLNTRAMKILLIFQPSPPIMEFFHWQNETSTQNR